MPPNKEVIEKQKQERLGEIGYNKNNTLMKIIKYNRSNDIIVEFQDEYKAKIHTEYRNFQKGNVRNPYDKTACGIGYLGEGKYKGKKNGKDTKEYICWRHMIERCYDPYEINKRPTYADVFVCEEWHNFQNFAKWYNENYYEVKNEQMCIDKDILVKGNKIYSPENCIFVPNRINVLFIKRQRDRGNCLIGVRWHKRDKMFDVSCCDKNCRQQYLGRFKNEYEGFLVYKQFKEKVIKQVADEYKDLIPQKLYNALYRYEVEIND